MHLWLSGDAAEHSREASPGEAIRAMGRRQLWWLLCLLAVGGVPVAVVVLTGGSGAMGFWVVSAVWLMGVVYGAILAVFIGLLALSPILLVVGKLVSDSLDKWVSNVCRVAVVVLAVGAFAIAAPLGDGANVRLPLPWPSLGALLVMAIAGTVSYLLWATGLRLKPEKTSKPPTRRHSVPEPEEEYWSDAFVIGWRSWNWDGSSLRGVYARWPTAEFEATCPHCDVVPSWDHVCGVYAAKDAGEVHVFYGWSPIVGRVEMWGDVIEHESGYRAARARITDLWVHDPHRATRIRAAYPTVNVIEGSPVVGQEV